MKIRVGIVTVSDSAVAGTRGDLSGPALEKRVQELGWQVTLKKLVRDEVHDISREFAALVDSGEVDVVLSTGGTGIAPRDVTPEAARTVAKRDVPGFGELMRAEGRKHTQFASLSRGEAYTCGAALLITLPGSPAGAVESLNAVAELIPHAVNLLHGRTEHHAKPGSTP
jgi:molybdopterin adenylyltransferase